MVIRDGAISVDVSSSRMTDDLGERHLIDSRCNRNVCSVARRQPASLSGEHFLVTFIEQQRTCSVIILAQTPPNNLAEEVSSSVVKL